MVHRDTGEQVESTAGTKLESVCASLQVAGAEDCGRTLIHHLVHDPVQLFRVTHSLHSQQQPAAKVHLHSDAHHFDHQPGQDHLRGAQVGQTRAGEQRF